MITDATAPSRALVGVHLMHTAASSANVWNWALSAIEDDSEEEVLKLEKA